LLLSTESMSSGVDSSFNKCKVAPVSTIPFSRARRGRDAWLCVRGLLHQANSADSVNS
jgi:hypothetical protein